MLPLKDDIPTRRFPILTVALIVANVAMFLFFQNALGDEQSFNQNVIDYGAIPYEVAHPGKGCEAAPDGQSVVCEGDQGVSGKPDPQPPTWLTLLTSMFMHGGLLHIAGNMLFLWIFGNNIEDSMGRGRFILFYVLGGLAALLAQTLIEPGSHSPKIGASGAVAAVLGGYALLYPRARVLTVIFIIIFFTVIRLPALLVLGFWFLLQLLDASRELSQPLAGEGGVAYFAHIGGFLFGLVMIKLFANKVHHDYLQPRHAAIY